MPRFTDDQLAFAASKRAYMGRDESIEFLKRMDIRMSVGHWSAGDFCDRFAPPGYHSDDPAFHRREFERLRAELESSSQASSLPEAATARPALEDLLVRLRLRSAD